MERPDDIGRFEAYVERDKVREGAPDKGQAEGLLNNAERKFGNMERMGLDGTTATDYLENTYEACRMLVQAFMAINGYKPYSHEAIIAYGIENSLLSSSQAARLNKYRKLRNDIVYRGESATIDEAEDIQKFFQNLLDTLKPQMGEEVG